MEQINKFINDALDEFLKSEKEMKINMLEIQKYFLSLLSNQNVIATGRVKSTNSLKEKILRKSYHTKFSNANEFIKSLDDIIGVRIICLLHNDEKTIWNIISSKLEEVEVDEKKYFVNSEKNIYLEKIILPVPQKNGHDIYKIHGYYKDGNVKYNFELQIKSLVHMLWGEIEHMLFYKNYEYIIDNSIYSSVMDSMYNNLMSIDSQLKDITDQMRGKNDSVMFDELKRMFAKILYEKINPIIEPLMGCMIDLRECYDAVIEVTLNTLYCYTYEECFKNIQNVMSKINSINVQELANDIPYYEYSNRYNRDMRLSEVAKSISVKSKENVYYRLFVFLVGNMCNKQGDNDILETVAEYYLRILKYEDDLEKEELGEIKIKFIIDVTDKYLLDIINKFDFYWIISNKSYILELIRAEISLVRTIDIDEHDDVTKVITLVKDILLLKTYIDKNQKINTELLNEIYEMSDNDIWFREELRNSKYINLISSYNIDENASRKTLKQILDSEEMGLC